MTKFLFLMAVLFSINGVSAIAAQVDSIASSCQAQCCLTCGCEKSECSPNAVKYGDVIPLAEGKAGSNADTATKASGPSN